MTLPIIIDGETHTTFDAFVSLNDIDATEAADMLAALMSSAGAYYGGGGAAAEFTVWCHPKDWKTFVANAVRKAPAKRTATETAAIKIAMADY